MVAAHETDAHRVHQRVLEITGFERDMTADVGYADAVPVIGDPADDAGEESPRAWRARWSEEQRVQHGGRPRPHREDVAQDPAHAGRRALIRLDRGRMVVALDL